MGNRARGRQLFLPAHTCTQRLTSYLAKFKPGPGVGNWPPQGGELATPGWGTGHPGVGNWLLQSQSFAPEFRAGFYLPCKQCPVSEQSIGLRFLASRCILWLCSWPAPLQARLGAAAGSCPLPHCRPGLVQQLSAAMTRATLSGNRTHRPRTGSTPVLAFLSEIADRSARRDASP